MIRKADAFGFCYVKFSNESMLSPVGERDRHQLSIVHSWMLYMNS
jgi:hypothetical protein